MTFSFFSCNSIGAKGLEPNTPEYQTSLLQDFAARSAMSQTDTPADMWYVDPAIQVWGPLPRKYPDVNDIVAKFPKGTDISRWKRDRVVAIAKQYINLPYMHHHIPAWNPQVPDKEGLTGVGLDCSNFTAWVYNFGFGAMISSDVVKQSQMIATRNFPLPAGIKRISADEKFLPGDLLFIYNAEGTDIVHVVIYIDKDHIIDSTKGHVDVRAFTGWYKTRLSHGVRIFN